MVENAPKRTEKMLEVEEKFSQPQGETLEQSLILMHLIEGKTPREMARDFKEAGAHLSATSVQSWIRGFGISCLDFSTGSERWRAKFKNPEIEAKRIEGIQKAWQERGPEIIAKREADGWKEKRLKGYKEFLNNPKAVKTRNRKAAQAKERVRQAKLQQLGNDPSEALREMVIEEGLTDQEIAHRTDLPIRFVYIKRIELGIKLAGKRHENDSKELEQRKQSILNAIQSGLFRQLTPRQQEVLEKLYLSRLYFPSQSQVARELRTSRQNIAIMEGKALTRLDEISRGKDVEIGHPSVINQKLGKNPREELEEIRNKSC